MLNSSKIYDAIELISLNRETIKNDIKKDIDNYLYNVAKIPVAFKITYEEHFPKFVSGLIINRIQDDLRLNPEEVLLLKETLTSSNRQILEYFYENH